MSKNLMHALAAVAAGAALSAFGVSGAHASGVAAEARPSATMPAPGASDLSPVPGTQLWVQNYGEDFSKANGLAVSPTAGTVFVTGSNTVIGVDPAKAVLDYGTVAYDPATGAQLWAQNFNAGGGYNVASSVAVSPTGSTAFVTGHSGMGGSAPYTFDYTTVAYDAATGTQLWVSRYNGPGNGDDRASSVAVSPSGSTVFVTGTSKGKTSGPDDATVAYNAATGARKWVSRYNGPGNGYDRAASIAVSPSGGRVFVTGSSKGKTSGPDYATVAYSARSGARKWVSRYNGPGNGADRAVSIAVSPSGGRVFVTGASKGKTSRPDYATIAYSARSGARKWVSRYNGPGNGTDRAASIAVSPSGGRVFVTGTSTGAKTGADYATVAYSARTGARKWVKRYDGSGFFGASPDAPSDDHASGVAVSPTGSTVYVTGSIESTEPGAHRFMLYNTIAYTAATGAQLWLARLGCSTPADSDALCFARSVAVSPAGGEVYVTGWRVQPDFSTQYGTVAYSG